MGNAKPTVTEQKAVLDLKLFVLETVQKEWPTIYEMLRTEFPGFRVADESMAMYDWGLAVLAQDLQAVRNLFPPDQAARIERRLRWTFDQVSPEYRDYALAEIDAYDRAFQRSVASLESGTESFVPTPISAIPLRLLYRWLGEGIRTFETEIDGEKTGLINPLLADVVVVLFTPFVKNWWNVKENFELVVI